MTEEQNLADIARRLERLEKQEWSELRFQVSRLNEQLEDLQGKQRLLLMFAFAGALAIPVVAWAPWFTILAAAVVF